MSVLPGELDHMKQIIFIWNIAGNMKAEVSRQHDRRLDLPPIDIWFGQKNMVVVLIGVSHAFPYALDAPSITFFHTGAGTTGSNGRERDALDRTHLSVPFADTDSQTLTSALG